MTASNNWFEISATGLRRTIGDRPKSFMLFELIQNSLDAESTRIDISVDSEHISCVDNGKVPWLGLDQTWTVFGTSSKSDNPGKRGIFCVGEKMVVAMCRQAAISTTKGTVEFLPDGTRRTDTESRTVSGTNFRAIIDISPREIDEIVMAVRKVLVPAGVTLSINEQCLVHIPPIKTVAAKLTTVIEDGGVLRRRLRETTVDILDADDGDGWLFEMGMPVVEIGCRWHINVGQRVPVELSRANVPEPFKRELGVVVAEAMVAMMTPDTANTSLVATAMEDPKISAEAAKAIVEARFGDKVVSFDPQDLEANKRAVAEGHVVIHGRQFSKEAWRVVRDKDLVRPAGQVTPTNPIGVASAETVPMHSLPVPGQALVAFMAELSTALIDAKVDVIVIKSSRSSTLADYGNRTMRLNIAKLGGDFFLAWPANAEKVIDLAIHELGHEYSNDHLSSRYYDALTRLGAKSTMLAVAGHPVFAALKGIRSP